MGSAMGNAICCLDAKNRKSNSQEQSDLFDNTLKEKRGENQKKLSKKSINSEKETEPNSKPKHPKTNNYEMKAEFNNRNKEVNKDFGFKANNDLVDSDIGENLSPDEAKDSVSEADENNDFDYIKIKPMTKEKEQLQNFIGLSIPLASVNYDSDEDPHNLEEKRHSKTCRNKKREVKQKTGDMTSKKNPKVTFEEIKESDDGLEDDPEEEEENIGGFGHFISSQKLSDDSPPPPKIALNQQMSTFTLCSGEEIKSSKFARSDSNNSMKKIRNLEKEKRLLFEKKQYDIFDKNGNISQRYKNSFEANYDINSDYIFQIQSYFSRGINSSNQNQDKYEWEEMKKANDYSIFLGNKGSLLHKGSPAFMIKIKFDKKFSYEMIVNCLSSSEQIKSWNKSITKCKDIIKFSENTLIVHTVYSPSFLIEKRDFIEKRFVTSIDDPKGEKLKTLIFKSSVPIEFLTNPECKLHGTTVFSICMIKYESEKDQTTITIIEQVHYGLKNIDKYTKVALPAQVDKMYRNLVEYMNSKLDDVFSI